MLERSLERYFPDLTAPLNERFPLNRRRRIFVGIALIAFVYANFRAFDDVQTKLDAIRDQPSESRWPALTANEAAALTSKLKALPSQDFVVACETVNSSMLCSDTMTQLRTSSRPIACLTFAGISIPIVSPSGGVWVIGNRTTKHGLVWLSLAATRQAGRSSP